MIDFEHVNPDFDRQLSREFEKRIGFDFPVSYVRFLERYNAARPVQNIVRLNHAFCEGFMIDTFYGITQDRLTNLNDNLDVYDDRIPGGYVPIAYTEGGNLVCMSPVDQSIVYWDHDDDLLIDEEKTGLLPIAESFEAFLEMIEPYDGSDVDLSGYTVRSVWIDPDFLKGLTDNNK